jgi:amidophosphoribosyltransferase
LHESCGIFGVYSPQEDVARLTFFGLFALQHRGQESAGIAAADGKRIRVYTGMGRVANVFTEESLKPLIGHMAIGHNRYSTTGSSSPVNAQPIVVGNDGETLAIAHNGNLVNASFLYKELTALGYVFHGSSDSEVIANIILSAPGKDMAEKIRYTMRRIQGAYSLVILTPTELYAVRDPLGVRPLCIGKVDSGFAIASETCALDHIGATFMRAVEPDEIVRIDENGLQSFPGESTKRGLCIFEYIYFARPDSVINGKLLYPTRQLMGAGLAREYPVDGDIVMSIPDSATAAANGYATASGLPAVEGLVVNRYVGRTFIMPDQRMRGLGVYMKFNPMPQVLNGERVVVVDDTIVRGTTTPQVVKMLRKAGAKEIHMRVCAPPIKYPCFFGVDMATRAELIAAQKSIPEICKYIGADSLGYLSIQGLLKAVDQPRENFCLACLTGEYPIPVQMEMDKLALETMGAGKPVEACDAIEDK